ncbi:hypothetical protein C8J57DRAFT_1473838 [Mycena rebaudengoi]|nr:hypothetical protein C8J57DRAFT_1473838 [Mycena rebaudengoi]
MDSNASAMESPFKHMLNTNIIPNDAECQQIRDFLVDPRKEAAHLAEQIARMQKVLEDLARKRDDLTEFIVAHLALVSPARRLPDDVVREIFVASLPKDRNCAISAKDSPLLLCTICQSWRNLALSTPRMWASIHIVAPSNDKIERMAQTVYTWLDRSGALPLSISLIVSRSTFPRPDASSLLTALIRYSLRWKRIRFILPPDQFEPLSSLSPEDVPILEEVIVDGFDNDTGHITMSPRLAFLRAISLWSVSLNAEFISPSTPIRLEFLRYLTFGNPGAINSHITSQSTLEILRRCALLETCAIQIYGDLDGPSTPCRMEHLRNLRVSFAGSEPIRIFETLVLPNLRRLEYSGPPELHLLPLLTSAQSIECLVLSSRGLTTALLAVLQLTPMLEELGLTGDPTTPSADPAETWFVPDGQFIPLLTSHAESVTVVCPRLKRITLMQAKALSDAALLEFILARPGLLEISVLFHREMQLDIAPSLQHLIAAGLTLSLQYQPLPASMPPYSPSEIIDPNFDWRFMYN